MYAKVCKMYDLDPTKFYTDAAAWEQYEKDVRDCSASGQSQQRSVAPEAPFTKSHIVAGHRTLTFQAASVGGPLDVETSQKQTFSYRIVF